MADLSNLKYPSEFSRRNQKLLAVRLRWPAGALAACWDLENRYPGWHVSWLGECTAKGFERPPGFWATLDHGGLRVEVFRTDLAEAEAVMETVPPKHDYSANGCSWCVGYGSRRVRL